MRGTKAKRIRKAVYGDNSIRTPRRYMKVEGTYRLGIFDGKPKSVTLVCIGPRRKYQEAKKACHG